MENEPKMMKVSIEYNGEFITTEVPVEATFRARFSGSRCRGHLRGIQAVMVEWLDKYPTSTFLPKDCNESRT